MHDSYKKLVRWMNRLFSRIEAKLSNQIKYIRLSYSMAAILFAIMSSSIFEYAAKEKFLSDSQIKFAQYAVVIVLVLFCFQLVYILLDIFFGKPNLQPPPPKHHDVKFFAHPSSVGVDLSEMTALAQDEFNNDTLRKDVVHAALRNRAGLGLRVTHENGKRVGFLDFYHLRPDILDQWLKGTILEGNIRADDFESITEVEARNQRELSLIVGAIVLRSGNGWNDYHLAPLLVAATKQYLREQLKAFDKVTIYATLFSNAGRRYSEIEDFKLYVHASDRGFAGGGHDVSYITFNPKDQARKFVSVARGATFILDVDFSLPREHA